MIIFETHLTEETLNFFQDNIKHLENHVHANAIIKGISGINCFFSTQDESSALLEKINEYNPIISESDRREFGDFQTNSSLATQVVNYAFSKFNDFEFVLEPTCGKGNFIIAAIKHSKTLKKIVGVEIYKPYVWETKFNILAYYLTNKPIQIPEIDIIHGNAFEFSYQQLAISTKHLKTLVIGNPPWVTNSELGSINSMNLPEKSNFKKHTGFDAITGKGNFDIGEYISLIMLNCFQYHNGLFVFLIKNSVIKNIIQDQKTNHYRICESEKLNIDTKKEFNVSVKASLFISKLNCTPEFTCNEFDFYTKEKITSFGWYKDKFVSSIKDYDRSCIIDGLSTFVWRSGIKHDCSKIMELEHYNGNYINGLNENVNIENDLVYGLLKSSDLKNDQTKSYRKLTIVTQNKIGQDTNYIREQYPLTYIYLLNHKTYFSNRKSSIYNDKPDFSIFGVGDYSFIPFKVAISGLYKSTHFTLVTPKDNKTVMLDDTCYFIGFLNLIDAKIAHFLVNSETVQLFLKSIIFSDSKRSVNKDTLMRIDFRSAFNDSCFDDAKTKLNELTIEDWNSFGELLVSKNKHTQVQKLNF